MKNASAPINQIPAEVLSLIAHHRDADEELIALTHVCRGWREIFISHPSLWTSLDCAVIGKTHVYLKRSKASPLDICLKQGAFLENTFLLVIPHLNRLGCLSLSGSSNDLFELTEHLRSPAPLLKTLALTITGTEKLVLCQGLSTQDTIGAEATAG